MTWFKQYLLDQPNTCTIRVQYYHGLWLPRFLSTSWLCLFCLCILHQSCLTITAGTANCLILGDWVPVYTSFGGSWGFNVPEGDSPQNTEPPFIAWFELLVSQTRSLASIMLDFSCGALQWQLYELVKSSYSIPVRRSHKFSQPLAFTAAWGANSGWQPGSSVLYHSTTTADYNIGMQSYRRSAKKIKGLHNPSSTQLGFEPINSGSWQKVSYPCDHKATMVFYNGISRKNFVKTSIKSWKKVTWRAKNNGLKALNKPHSLILLSENFQFVLFILLLKHRLICVPNDLLHHYTPLGDKSEYVNPYIPTQTPEEDWGDQM